MRVQPTAKTSINSELLPHRTTARASAVDKYSLTSRPEHDNHVRIPLRKTTQS